MRQDEALPHIWPTSDQVLHVLLCYTFFTRPIYTHVTYTLDCQLWLELRRRYDCQAPYVHSMTQPIRLE